MKTIIVPSDDLAVPFERVDYPESKKEAEEKGALYFLGALCKVCGTRVSVLRRGRIVEVPQTLRHVRSRCCTTCQPEERELKPKAPRVPKPRKPRVKKDRAEQPKKVKEIEVSKNPKVVNTEKVTTLNGEPSNDFNELESLSEIQKARKNTRTVRNNTARRILEDRRIAAELGLTLEEYYQS